MVEHSVRRDDNFELSAFTFDYEDDSYICLAGKRLHQSQRVEILLVHLKRILRMDRLRLRGPNGARDEFLLAAIAQNLRKMAKLIPMPATPAPA